MEELLVALAEGKQLVDSRNTLWKFEEVILESGGETSEFTLEDLAELSIYNDPKDIEIMALKKVIHELKDKIIEHNSEGAKSKERKKRKHLLKGEIRDIETAIENDEVEDEWIMSTYDISYATLLRVQAHKHKFSTVLPII